MTELDRQFTAAIMLYALIHNELPEIVRGDEPVDDTAKGKFIEFVKEEVDSDVIH